MNPALSRLAERSVDPALLIGRLLLAAIFLHEGVVLALDLGPAVAGMARLGVPAPLAVTTIGFQVGAGMALAVGWHARAVASALALFCLATALLFHVRFAVRNEVLHFEKDLAIAGGMIVLAIRGAGSWSIDALRCPTPARAFVPGQVASQ